MYTHVYMFINTYVYIYIYIYIYIYTNGSLQGIIPHENTQTTQFSYEEEGGTLRF